jgi:hypothetical protein
MVAAAAVVAASSQPTGVLQLGIQRLVIPGALVSSHDRDRAEVVSRWPRCLAVVSS